jgi:hypothetical protein
MSGLGFRAAEAWEPGRVAGSPRHCVHGRGVEAFVRRATTRMITRVVDEARIKTDRLAGLRAIAIDEKDYRKGHRYLTIVTDVDTGRLVWACEGVNRSEPQPLTWGEAPYP